MCIWVFLSAFALFLFVSFLSFLCVCIDDRFMVCGFHEDITILFYFIFPKQETLLGRVARAEGRRLRETERTALPHDSQSQVLWSLG